MLPVIAIVGRPNVGKSSLFNRLAGERISIVDPTPGVTRDRISTIITINPPNDTDEENALPRVAELCDTGGFGIYVAEGKRFDDAGEDLAALAPDIESQIFAAVEGATIVLFTIDAQSGITALDEKIAQLLRRAGNTDRVIQVANKVDGPSWEVHALEAAKLGFGDTLPVSTKAGSGIRRLMEALWARLASRHEEPPASPEMKVAIVGRRNAGKSSLVNSLAGAPRVIVSEIAGTTRDSVDVRFESEGRIFIAIDTAGIRKRKSWADDVEFYSHNRTQVALRRADVAMLLLDATEPVSQVEKQLAGELVEAYKPTVIVVNKWDLVEAKQTPNDYLDYLTQELPMLNFAPLVFISAKNGDGTTDAVAMAFNLHTQASHRETTGKLNVLVQKILTERGPSSKLGTIAKIYYISQIETNPPTIAMVVNKPELFEGAYEKYLLNRLREELPYSEVPIKLIFSARRRDPEDVKNRRSAGRT
ncbi:MAG: ribosome biogenesis GTPase Der [Planctomycetota bacterium]|nr:ribosome biogenesis GTPase Der [Planctomycetota bacterium]MDA1261893.1 ribosome biogenesis GTPase Der [Planctomycetota bacterium]